jgi:hypothetical protein
MQFYVSKNMKLVYKLKNKINGLLNIKKSS